MSTLLGITKEILSLFLNCLISSFLFLLAGEMLLDLLCPPIMPSDFNPVRLIGIFYILPFCLVAVFLGKNSLWRWWRLALFILVLFLIWDKSDVLGSIVLGAAFLLSFACLLGLEKANKLGRFHHVFFKILTGIISYVVFAIPVALGMRGLLWNLDVGSASDYMFEMYAFYTFLPICLALPFITHIFPLRVALIAIALFAPLLGISSAGISWVALYIGAMALSIIFSQVVTSRCHFLNSGTHALKH